MELIAKSLSWLVGGTYAAVLFATNLNRAVAGQPVVSSIPWWDTRSVTFGITCLAFLVGYNISAVGLMRARPSERAHRDLGLESFRGLPFGYRLAARLRVFRLTVRALIIPCSVAFLSFLVAFQGNMRPVAIACISWVAGILWTVGMLRDVDRNGGEDPRHGLSDDVAMVLGVFESRTDFRRIFFVLLPVTTFAFSAYPFTTQALGGGRPIPASVHLTSESSPIRFPSGVDVESAELLFHPSSQGLLLFQDAETGDYLAIGSQHVAAVSVEDRLWEQRAQR